MNQAGQPTGPQIAVVIVIIAIAPVLGGRQFIFFAKYFNLWIQAKMTHANVGIWELIGDVVPQGEGPNIIVRSKNHGLSGGSVGEGRGDHAEP